MEVSHAPEGWLQRWDGFRVNSTFFREDVRDLVLEPMRAAIAHLDTEAVKATDRLAPDTQGWSAEDLDTLSEKKGEIEERAEDQKRFQRNMALVALLARLIYTLKQIAQLGEAITPRKKDSYKERNARDSEFMELFREYRERFQIDLVAKESGRVAFIEPLRKARNKVVHEGGRANPFKHSSEVNLSLGDEGFLNLNFSKESPELVEGEGSGAQVNISEQQLDEAAASSIELVRWLASEMSARGALSGNPSSGFPAVEV
jgi:hypothetical protein